MYLYEQQRAEARRLIQRALPLVEQHLVKVGVRYGVRNPYSDDFVFTVVIPTRFPALNVAFDLRLTWVSTKTSSAVPVIVIPGWLDDTDASFTRGLEDLGLTIDLSVDAVSELALTERYDPERPHNFPAFVQRVLDFLFPITETHNA